MKKLVLLILGFILGALAMYFYCSNNQLNIEDMTEETPKGTITPAEIKVLTEAYNPRYDSISSKFFRGVEGGDNRSSWYSLVELEAFIKSAKAQAGTLKHTMDGVRVYLGAHPQVGNIPGYTTLLFVPTGYPNTAEGSMIGTKLQDGGNDIPGANGLDKGGVGTPPGANYPQ